MLANLRARHGAVNVPKVIPGGRQQSV